MYYFIVNPRAKSGKGQIVWNNIERILKRRHIPYEALYTEYKDHGRELAREAAGRDDDHKIIVAMGGDGTIAEVMEGIWDHRDVTFAYIPLGSGNDFARGLGISSNWKRALKGLLNEEHRIHIHPGRLEFDGKVRHFGGSMGIGFDAAVCDGANRLRFKKFFNWMGLGKFTYSGVAMKHIFSSSCDKMKIRLDGKEVHRFKHVFFMCGLNAKYEGGGFMFTPDGEMDDDYLHICLVDSIPPLKRLLLLPKALVGKHVGAKGIYQFKCKKVEILSQEPKLIHGDGEVYGKVKKLTAMLEEERIPMVY